MSQFEDDDDDGGLPDAAFTETELAAGVQHIMRGSSATKPNYESTRSLHSKKAKAYVLTERDAPLFEALKNWRRAKALESNVPAYRILYDIFLDKLVECKPQSQAELLQALCLGRRTQTVYAQAKFKRYGEELLALLTQTYPVSR